MYRRPLSSSILMDVSELRIEDMRWSGTYDERQVVSRLFETPVVYQHWEGYHAGLMRSLGEGGTRKGQVQRMRQTRFQLIHRQALFEYLRESAVTGRQREALVGTFHRTKDYARAMVAEHASFLHSNSSLYCADHLAFSIMRDWHFSSMLDDYRRQYLEYFGLHCKWVIAESQGQDFNLRCLIPETKKGLETMRQDLLALPAPPRWSPRRIGFC